VDNLSFEVAAKEVEKISNLLKEKMTKKWKCLPSLSLPHAYNIVTLPYKKI
jgi:DNA polymerase I-like protein with 3'-5' exonuclease and polymerase domains